MSATPEEIFSEAVGTLLELRRALHKRELREPEFREAAIQALVGGGETKTDALRKYKMDEEYAKFATELLEAGLAVERQEALVEVRRYQMLRTLKEVETC